MRRRLLIADDDATLRSLLRLLVERDGRFELVAEAIDGRQAIELVQQHDPDVLLLDLAMPSMDGLEVLQALGRPTRPLVVVLTGFVAPSLRQQVTDAGAVACLEKGRDFAVLLDRLDELLTARWARGSGGGPAAQAVDRGSGGGPAAGPLRCQVPDRCRAAPAG